MFLDDADPDYLDAHQRACALSTTKALSRGRRWTGAGVRSLVGVGVVMRVNMDSSIASDPRFKKLGRALGISWREAIGSCFLVWLACYERRAGEFPADEIDIAAEIDGFAEALVAVGLAHVVDDALIALHGVDQRIEFLLKQAEKGRRGGNAKAKKALAPAKQMLAERVANATGVAVAYTPALTPSPAQSHTPARGGFDLEAIYQAYPKKVGKKDGCKKLRTKVQDKDTYTTVLKAAQEMGRLWSGEDLTYCPGFAPWVNQERWQDDSQQGPSRDGRAAPPAPREIKI